VSLVDATLIRRDFFSFSLRRSFLWRMIKSDVVRVGRQSIKSLGHGKDRSKDYFIQQRFLDNLSSSNKPTICVLNAAAKTTNYT
jgi:hypothetical protein